MDPDRVCIPFDERIAHAVEAALAQALGPFSADCVFPHSFPVAVTGLACRRWLPEQEEERQHAYSNT